MTDKATFKKAFGNVLEEAGFLRKGKLWFKEGSDLYILFGLQKSDYDDKYFINFGVWLKAIEPTSAPSIVKSHIQSRLTALFPEETQLVESASRVNVENSDDLQRFISFVRSTVIPHCAGYLAIDVLRSALVRGDFRRSLVMKVAKDFLTG